MNNFARDCGLLLGLFLASGCQPKNEFVPPPPPKVTVAFPLLRPVQEYFETTGQTRAVQTVELRARVGGYLEEVRFKDGQLVKKGDVLFVIDQETYAAAVASAKANLKRAQAQLRLAEQQLMRTKLLAREDAATESALDIQNADRDSKDADVDAAKAALQDAELNLGYTVITAPFDGLMGRHLVDVGNLIIAGDTLLSTLESVNPIQAYFTVSESDLLRFMEMQKEGKLKRITDADPLKLDLALGDTGEFRFHGQLDFRRFGIDPTTGTTERRAVFPNDPPELLPGLFVRIRAKLGDPRPYLLVDEQALGRDQRGDFLLVVNDENKVETKLVKLGPSDHGLQAIDSGIQQTDRVVIKGLQRARPGSTVDPELVAMDSRLVEAPAGGAAPVKPGEQNEPGEQKSSGSPTSSGVSSPGEQKPAEATQDPGAGPK